MQLQQIPAHAAGVVDITATDIDTGQQAILKGGWTYGSPVSPGYMSAVRRGTPFSPFSWFFEFNENEVVSIDLYWFDFDSSGNTAIIATGYTGSVIAVPDYQGYGSRNSYL